MKSCARALRHAKVGVYSLEYIYILPTLSLHVELWIVYILYEYHTIHNMTSYQHALYTSLTNSQASNNLFKLLVKYKLEQNMNRKTDIYLV